MSKKKKYFGTDGIRGTANTHPMTAEMALRVGIAAGQYFTGRDERRHNVVVGKDTRLSGYMLQTALVAGFTSVGMDVKTFGPLPTPAVANLTRSMRADLGVMLTASHNAFHDNGIKLFGPDGYKLDDDTEMAIESLIDDELDAHLTSPRAMGRVTAIDDALARYIEVLKATFPRRLSLKGLRIVVDCANGAAYRVAPLALYELGAEVVSIGVEPDGFNINAGCGSTYPQTLSKKVVELRADLGIALDGDADRLIIVDERGQVVDGDQILALIASDWHDAGRLTKDGVVATVMSNLGLERYLAAKRLKLERTRVGDRYVTEKMRAKGYNVGGEQSGHLVLSDFATTGDGMIAALQVLAALVAGSKPASERLQLFQPVPQILENVRITGDGTLARPAVKAAIRDAETRLGEVGRLVVRESGTEPVVRIMVEGDDEGLVRAVVNDLAGVVAAPA